MVIEVLVREQIEAGRALIVALERESFPISGALWHRHEQIGGYWQLLIFSDLVKQKGPLEAYKELRRIWDKVAPKEISFTDVSVLHPDDPLYAAMRADAVRRPIPGRRSRDVSFPDAYVYAL
jgi:hypothetical protein